MYHVNNFSNERNRIKFSKNKIPKLKVQMKVDLIINKLQINKL